VPQQPAPLVGDSAHPGRPPLHPLRAVPQGTRRRPHRVIPDRTQHGRHWLSPRRTASALGTTYDPLPAFGRGAPGVTGGSVVPSGRKCVVLLVIVDHLHLRPCPPRNSSTRQFPLAMWNPWFRTARRAQRNPQAASRPKPRTEEVRRRGCPPPTLLVHGDSFRDSVGLRAPASPDTVVSVVGATYCIPTCGLHLRPRTTKACLLGMSASLLWSRWGCKRTFID